MRTRFVVAIVAVALVAALPAEPVTAAAGADLAVLVTDARGIPLTGAMVTAATVTAVTDHSGRARLLGVGPGTVSVSHPRFPDRSVHWSGGGDRLRIPLGHHVLRALHITGALPGGATWASTLALADITALNAVMLDMKDESGFVYPTWTGTAPAPVGLGLWDLAAVADELHARDLALIVRIVAFQDPRFAAVAPHAAVHDAATGGPFSRRGQVFLDPSDTTAQRYVRELVVAACGAGVDEVQLDYIRFPDGITPSLRFDAVDPTVEEQRTATISEFIGGLRDLIPADCALAADIFGFVTSVAGDGGIGQDIEVLATRADVLSPMVYPNHWSRGWFGYDEPADHPGGVVTASLANALDRVGDEVTIRPWLQDFGGYGPAEVRAQIDAADALGLGWMIWNAASQFQRSAIPTDAEVTTPSMPPPPTEEDRPASGFWDVADGSTFWSDVRWLGEQGITQGCNPPWRDAFCPDRALTRAEAATLLVRALGLAPTTVDFFGDDDGNTHEANINALAAARITRGCTPTEFCPDLALTRAQMASLIARALGLPYVAADSFTDDDNSTHEADIERIAAVGITRGCAFDRFCPHDPVTRGQVAAFFRRALADG